MRALSLPLQTPRPACRRPTARRGRPAPPRPPRGGPPPRGPPPPRGLASGEGDPSQPPSPATIIVRLLVAVAVAAVVSILSAPSLLSTKRGRGALLAAINTRLAPHSRLTVDAASLSWRSPPLLTGVRLTDAAGVVVASADRVSASGSLAAVVAAAARWRPPWPFTRRRTRNSPPAVDVVVDAPRVDLSVDGAGGGLTRLQRALGATPPPRVADAEGDLLAGIASDSGGQPSLPPPAPFGPPVPVQFSAEARVGDARFVAARGVATLPADAAEALGGDIHAVLLVGRNAIRDDSDALSPCLADGSASVDDGTRNNKAQPYDPSWTATPPRGAGAPFAFEVRSPSAALTCDGWRRARRGVELRAPAVARAVLTPALAKHGLTRLSPLLASSAAMTSDGAVVVRVGGRGARLPARRVHARVEPLTLRVRAQRGAKGRPRGLAAAALDWLGATAGGGALVARTSGADVDIVVGGATTCRRVDVLLTPATHENDPDHGVHLFTYGAVDGRRCAATLGVPGATLARAGFKGVPPHAALRVAVRGPVAAPRVDWVAASADAAALAAASAAASDSGGGAVGAVRRMILSRAASGLRRRREGAQPALPAEEELPWAPREVNQIDAVLQRQAVERERQAAE